MKKLKQYIYVLLLSVFIIPCHSNAITSVQSIKSYSMQQLRKEYELVQNALSAIKKVTNREKLTQQDKQSLYSSGKQAFIAALVVLSIIFTPKLYRSWTKKKDEPNGGPLPPPLLQKEKDSEEQEPEKEEAEIELVRKKHGKLPAAIVPELPQEYGSDQPLPITASVLRESIIPAKPMTESVLSAPLPTSQQYIEEKFVPSSDQPSVQPPAGLLHDIQKGGFKLRTKEQREELEQKRSPIKRSTPPQSAKKTQPSSDDFLKELRRKQQEGQLKVTVMPPGELELPTQTPQEQVGVTVIDPTKLEGSWIVTPLETKDIPVSEEMQLQAKVHEQMSRQAQPSQTSTPTFSPQKKPQVEQAQPGLLGSIIRAVTGRRDPIAGSKSEMEQSIEESQEN